VGQLQEESIADIWLTEYGGDLGYSRIFFFGGQKIRLSEPVEGSSALEMHDDDDDNDDDDDDEDDDSVRIHLAKHLVRAAPSQKYSNVMNRLSMELTSTSCCTQAFTGRCCSAAGKVTTRLESTTSCWTQSSAILPLTSSRLTSLSGGDVLWRLSSLSVDEAVVPSVWKPRRSAISKDEDSLLCCTASVPGSSAANMYISIIMVAGPRV